MEKLYVFAGKAKTGKDTAASVTEKYYQDNGKLVIRYSCTVYLKKYIKEIYNWDGNEETKPREILQSLGEEIKDKYPNFFIDRMKEDIKFLSKHCDILIITGIRLVPELNYLKEEPNSILIKIGKSNLDNKLTEKQKQDITETDVDKFKNYDFVIQNDLDINELNKKIIKLIEEVDHEY